MKHKTLREHEHTWLLRSDYTHGCEGDLKTECSWFYAYLPLKYTFIAPQGLIITP